jgi:hypothetical protein
MFTRLSTRLAFAVVFSSAPLLAAAGDTDRFANGESLYGTLPASTGNVRVIDVNAARYLNVQYGDTVVFTNGDKRFAWTFNGLDRVAVKLEQIAPHDFGARDFTVYVPIDPSQRN